MSRSPRIPRAGDAKLSPALYRKGTPPADPSGLAAEFKPSTSSQDLSEFEYALIILMFGFQRWVENCIGAANVHGLNALDTLVLHTVNHRARGKRLAEICMVLNIGDTHLVTYALKKLAAADLVLVTPIGRERHFETTADGEKACLEYRIVRENFLVPSLSWVSGRDDSVNDTAGFLRMMTALYDQAGRFATAATAGQPKAPPVHTKR
ncbi:MAG: winged helix DNA-binding protein [Betaproteobacteria bacterium]|nr:winged helix DNA-binding protein [Betaproteobacteria bacterium]